MKRIKPRDKRYCKVIAGQIRSTPVFWILLFIAAFPINSFCGETAPSKNVLAVIDGKNISVSEAEKYLMLLPEADRVKFQNSKMKNIFIRDFIDTELLFREGVARGVSNDERVRLRLQSLERILVRDLYINNFIMPKVKVTEDDAFNYYKSHKNDFVDRGYALAEHIAVLSKEEAERIKEEINSGKISFEDAVKKYSIDKYTSGNKGALPLILNGRPIEGYRDSGEIIKLAFSAKVGTVAGPVKSLMGWHILRIKSRKDDMPRAYDTVKGEVKNMVTKEKLVKALDEEIDKLKKNYKVKVFPENMK
ncbi:MAG: peptidyl-prolyl cis-trans isomerase [Candidatus Schekmanbacteria bacterium]|nr:peptidyl-prolyl cis-trans isomerase [Candidatus Schekmanbacteria bacterium]